MVKGSSAIAPIRSLTKDSLAFTVNTAKLHYILSFFFIFSSCLIHSPALVLFSLSLFLSLLLNFLPFCAYAFPILLLPFFSPFLPSASFFPQSSNIPFPFTSMFALKPLNKFGKTRIENRNFIRKTDKKANYRYCWRVKERMEKSGGRGRKETRMLEERMKDNKEQGSRGGVRRTPFLDLLRKVLLKIRKTKCFIT